MRFRGWGLGLRLWSFRVLGVRGWGLGFMVQGLKGGSGSGRYGLLLHKRLFWTLQSFPSLLLWLSAGAGSGYTLNPQSCITLRTLNHGTYGRFLVMGNAGFLSSTVCLGYKCRSHEQKPCEAPTRRRPSSQTSSVFRALELRICGLKGFHRMEALVF